MFSQTHYLLRSRTNGQYLTATSGGSHPEQRLSYLLIFRENFEALSYLNAHGSGVAEQFAVESVAGTQLKNVLQRWGFNGVGLVQDPLVPQIEFLSYG